MIPPGSTHRRCRPSKRTFPSPPLARLPGELVEGGGVEGSGNGDDLQSLSNRQSGPAQGGTDGDGAIARPRLRTRAPPEMVAETPAPRVNPHSGQRDGSPGLMASSRGATPGDSKRK